MKHKYFSLIIASFITSTIFAQTTITLQASKDAAIGYHDGANTANNNYGYATQNAAYCIPAVASSGVNSNRALIDFSLSSIPQNATIVSAYINLYALGPFGSLPGHTGNNNASYLERITQNWTETGATWNNQPSSSAVNRVTLNQSSSATQNYLNIDVKLLVQDMINNPSSSFGFKLRLINEATTNCLAFASKDHSNSSMRPTLVVTYSTQCSNTDSLIADYDAAIGYHDGANTANNNYGGAYQNAAYAIPSVAAPGGLNVNRALMHFNLNNIPAGATITNAEMDLFAYGPAGAYPGHYGTANNGYLERVTGGWSEYSVTWNTQPSTTQANRVTLNGTNNATLDYLNINVTTLIQDIIQSSSNNGFMLKLAAENSENLLFFCSKDHPDANKHPRLRVTYTTCSLSSVSELNNSFSIAELYPNPSNGGLSIKYQNNNSKNIDLEIVDINGRIVKTYKLSNTETVLKIDNLDLENGIYFCNFLSDNNHLTTKKLVIAK